jgi:outer membrane protein OmpA-like peptidoglycan-associated protein
MDKRLISARAHDVVRLALEAQKRAEERSFQAALDAERKAQQEEQARLKTSIEQARTETERARLAAQQRQMELNLEEQARRRVEQQFQEASQRAAEEARRRQQAEQEAWQARQQASQEQLRAQQLAAEKSAAEQEAARAREERERARARLQQALSSVVETRETARGVIVNLPDVLFDFNKSTLKPHAREVLSKVCGILLVVQGYDLSVEGHTDAIGSDSYNQELSEKRAQSVENFLENCGLSGTEITAKGFGESQPVASNDTASGRQQNRRVEVVIEDTEAFQVGSGTRD